MAHLRRIATLLLLALSATVTAQTVPNPAAPRVMDSAAFTTAYVRLGLPDADALLYRPAGPVKRIALVFAHPSGRTFHEPLGAQMAARGHLVAMVNYHATNEPDDAYLPALSQAIRFLRAQPGVERVILVGHSGGGHLAALYQAAAEVGPGACNGPEKIYPCRTALASGLEIPDGLALLDPTLGAFHQMSAIDPAWEAKGQADADTRALDMYAPAAGYDPATKAARYAPSFIARFHAAQAARSREVVEAALLRLRAIEAGKGMFSDNEPFLVGGMGVTSAGARLYQADTRLLSHTRAPHLLLKADGTAETAIVRSARPPLGQIEPGDRRSLKTMAQNTTVRSFLGSSAIRTAPEFTLGEDSITGVDWKSAFSATPGNALHISKPTLILTMGCHYLVVPGEIVFDSLAAKDKTYAAVEGATHLFNPCKPQYGDTMKRTFDFLEDWLSAKRFH